MYRVIEIKTGQVLYEHENLDKAKDYAELYKKNMGKDSFIQDCRLIWSTQSIGDFF